MSWKPSQEIHAIERVRLSCQFAEPLTAKLLEKIAVPLVENCSSFDLERISPAQDPTGMAGANGGFQIVISNSPPPPTHRVPSYRFERRVDNVQVEELVLATQSFTYVTLQYGRWENFINRISKLLVPTLNEALDLADLPAFRLEYWDGFSFDGDSSEANTAELLKLENLGIPKEVIKNNDMWHSHRGWFEQQNSLLINVNLDIVDRNVSQDVQRWATVYTLVEKRIPSANISIKDFHNYLEEAHSVSKRCFANCILPEMQKKIGLTLEKAQ